MAEKCDEFQRDTMEEVDTMPSIELIEHERVAYLKGMEEYLQQLKRMPDKEAVKRSRTNLESCHIIQADGEFSENYSYSRMHAECKG